MTPSEPLKALHTALPLAGLEIFYDELAQAIDAAAAQDKAMLFLVKLALLNAHALGDQARCLAQIQTALRDL